MRQRKIFHVNDTKMGQRTGMLLASKSTILHTNYMKNTSTKHAYKKMHAKIHDKNMRKFLETKCKILLKSVKRWMTICRLQIIFWISVILWGKIELTFLLPGQLGKYLCSSILRLFVIQLKLVRMICCTIWNLMFLMF